MDVARQLRDGILLRPGGERVQIGNDEQTLVFVLQLHAVLYAANPVTEVQPPGGTVAGQDPLSGTRHS